MDCRPNNPLSVTLFAPDLCVRTGFVDLIFVMGCVYQATVPWNLRREKICDCEMVEVKVGTSLYEMRHTCVHRPLVELYPLSGIVSVKYLIFYVFTTVETLCLKQKWFHLGMNHPLESYYEVFFSCSQKTQISCSLGSFTLMKELTHYAMS